LCPFDYGLFTTKVKTEGTTTNGIDSTLGTRILSFQNMSTDFPTKYDFVCMAPLTLHVRSKSDRKGVERLFPNQWSGRWSNINNVKKNCNPFPSRICQWLLLIIFNDAGRTWVLIVDMRESLDMVTSQFDDSIGSPTIMKMNPDMMPIMVAALDYDKLDNWKCEKGARGNYSGIGVWRVTLSMVSSIEKKIQVIIQQDKIDKMNELVQKAIEGKLSDAQDKIDEEKN
ncbi:MAG: hypothetical protein ACLTJ5_10730, partial [Clostridium sp.]